MSQVSDRRKVFEAPAAADAADAAGSGSTKNRKKIGTFSSRRNRNKGKGATRSRANKERRIDLSDDEEMLDDDNVEKSKTEPRFSAGKFNKPTTSATSSATATATLSEKPTTAAAAAAGIVDLDLIASSLAKRPAKKALISGTNKRESDISVDVDLTRDATTKSSSAPSSLTWKKRLSHIWTDPLAEEKQKQEAIFMQAMKETDSSFNEETYRLEKQTQSMFVDTKKEEMEQKKAEEDRKRAKRQARMKASTSWWESIVQTLIAIFISSVDAEKRKQEKALLSRLPLLELRMDEEDVRREMETQALLVNMKKKEMERERMVKLSPLQVEKRRKSQLLAQKLSDPSVGLDQNLIARGSKIQQSLVRRSMNAASKSGSSGGSSSHNVALAQQAIPLEIQKQMQEELLLEMADDDDQGILSEHALKRSREVQESLIFYAQKNKSSGWLDSIFSKTTSNKRSSIPQEVIATDDDDDMNGTNNRVSWLDGWKTSFSTTPQESVLNNHTAEKRSDVDDSSSVSSWLFGKQEQNGAGPAASATLSPTGFGGRNKKKKSRASWLTLSMMTSDFTKSSSAAAPPPPWSQQTNLQSLSSLGEEDEDPTIHKI